MGRLCESQLLLALLLIADTLDFLRFPPQQVCFDAVDRHGDFVRQHRLLLSYKLPELHRVLVLVDQCKEVRPVNDVVFAVTRLGFQSVGVRATQSNIVHAEHLMLADHSDRHLLDGGQSRGG